MAHSEETKRKIGIGNKGKLKGKKRTPESIAKSAAGKRSGSFFKCQVCNAEFWRPPSVIKKGQSKFCSKKCYQLNQVGKPKSEAFKKFCRERTGESSATWRGGITPVHLKIRNSKAYSDWRASVFIRDSYACQHCFARCGNGVDGHLHAHHISSFAEFPEQRFDVPNGITLCKACHYKVHSNVLNNSA